MSFLTWCEISRENFKKNLEIFKILIPPNILLLPVIKANAYGHGMLEIASLLLENGIEWLGVNDIEEALLIRKNYPNVKILILGYVLLDDLETAILNNFSIIVYNRETVKRLVDLSKKLKKKISIHLKIETGNNRQGVTKEDALELVSIIKESPYINIEGISTHFADIEDTTDHTFAFLQLKRFKEAIKYLEKRIGQITYKHCANTAATLLMPETYFDLVRVGIGIYGMWPSKETYITALIKNKENIKFYPILTWKTRVAQIKFVRKGEYVGYGRTYQATSNIKIAVLPVGYYDGYDRHLSNRSYVLIGGEKAYVRGRICMNMMMVDVTNIKNIKLEDEVVLLGRQGNEIITAEYLADLIGTINYEVTTRINERIPRIIV